VKSIKVSMDQLSRIAFKLFAGMGLREKDAARAADVLVETNRRGVDTHGVARLGFYHWCVDTKRVNPRARLRILRDDPPFLMADAGNGLGIVMAPQALELAMEKAGERGICVMGVQNSSHFGAAGYYTAKCVERASSPWFPPIPAPRWRRSAGETGYSGTAPGP
jgi:LDH2 family malate/lactate/ureidoglycolate dehydrogenase